MTLDVSQQGGQMMRTSKQSQEYTQTDADTDTDTRSKPVIKVQV